MIARATITSTSVNPHLEVSRVRSGLTLNPWRLRPLVFNQLLRVLVLFVEGDVAGEAVELDRRQAVFLVVEIDDRVVGHREVREPPADTSAIEPLLGTTEHVRERHALGEGALEDGLIFHPARLDVEGPVVLLLRERDEEPVSSF